MKLLLIFLVLICLTGSASAVTLAELTVDFRERILETDTATSLIPDTIIHTYLNQSQDKIVRMGGYLRKTYPIVFDEDSSSFGMPNSFKSIDMKNGVMRQSAGIFSGQDWFSVLYNPGFRLDTTTAQYTVGWDTTDAARLYIKGNMEDGDSIKVFYKGKAASMDSTAAVCEVSDDDHVFIIEEAIAMYEQAKRAHQVQQMLQQRIRQDMGIIKQVEQ